MVPIGDREGHRRVQLSSPGQTAVCELRIIIAIVDVIDFNRSDVAGTEFGRKVRDRSIFRTGDRVLFWAF